MAATIPAVGDLPPLDLDSFSFEDALMNDSLFDLFGLESDAFLPPQTLLCDKLLANPFEEETPVPASIPTPPSAKTKVDKTPTLTLETIKQLDLLLLPMEQAAKRLSFGTTVFKRKLRVLGIKRWPGRTMKSILTAHEFLKAQILEKGWRREESQRMLDTLNKARQLLINSPLDKTVKEVERLIGPIRSITIKRRYSTKQQSKRSSSSGSETEDGEESGSE